MGVIAAHAHGWLNEATMLKDFQVIAVKHGLSAMDHSLKAARQVGSYREIRFIVIEWLESFLDGQSV